MTGHVSLDRTGRVRRKRQQQESEASTATPESKIVALQGMVGNQGVQRMLAQGQIDSPVQAPSALIARQTAVGDPAATSPFEGEHTVVRNGAKGREVVYLQRRLNLYGANLVEDGIWGNKTSQAVIAFQSSHQLAADGVVGPLTWGELDKAPPNSELKKDADDTPAADQTKIGGFQNFVDQGVLSQTAARIMHEMLHLPGFGSEMAKFAHQELSNGKLVGFVRASESDKVKNKLHSKHHRLLADDVNSANSPGINAVTRGVIGESRSYILFKDAELDRAGTGKSARDFVVLEIAHELTHHRNRVDFDRQASPAESPNSPAARDFFVDVERAKRFPNTEFVRATFIDEIVARHVAFQVDNDRKPAAEQKQVKGGQLFKAALDLARAFTPYNDNGYMRDLATNAPELFRQQVGQWLGEVAKRSFHSDPKINGKIQAFVLGEFTGNLFNGFAEPGVTAEGLR